MVVALTMVSVFVWTAGTVMVFELTGVIAGPVGGVPVIVAVLMTDPASRSIWVMVWVPVQMVDAPGPNVVAVQVIPEVTASVTVTLVRVTLPVLVTVNV